MSNPLIHPTALIAQGADLGANVRVGPYCIVGPHAVIHDNVTLQSHVVIEGHTSLGSGTQVFPFAVLGCAPQSSHYKGEDTALTIGENCLIREHVTIHRGTLSGGGVTLIGNNCFLMVGVHIAHDCHIGNWVVMANNATLGGHVTVGDGANIGGLAAVHQFVRIGPYTMISGTAGVSEDVIPFGMVMAMRGKLGGLNLVGMKRRGFSREDIRTLRNAYNILAREQTGTLEERLQRVREAYGECGTVQEVIRFIEDDPKRPLCLPAETWEFQADDPTGSDHATCA